MTKKCSKCGEDKSLNSFYRDKRKSDGLCSSCKKCHNEANILSARKYKEKRYEIAAIWRKKNPEKASAIWKRHREKHKEERREKFKDWYHANIDAQRVVVKERIKRKRLENPEYFREYDRKRYRLNRLSRCMSTSIYRALKGEKKGKKWQVLVGYSLKELKQHLEVLFQDGMSWDNYGEWHLDHIKPKSLFNYSCPNDLEFMECWRLENLQPLWAEENMTKGNKYNV